MHELQRLTPRPKWLILNSISIDQLLLPCAMLLIVLICTIVSFYCMYLAIVLRLGIWLGSWKWRVFKDSGRSMFVPTMLLYHSFPTYISSFLCMHIDPTSCGFLSFLSFYFISLFIFLGLHDRFSVFLSCLLTISHFQYNWLSSFLSFLEIEWYKNDQPHVIT